MRADAPPIDSDAAYPQRRRSPAWSAMGLVAFWAGLALLFGGSLAAHMRRSADPASFNDDVRAQIYPFFRYESPGAFRNDELGDYFLYARSPIGFRALYAAAGHAGWVEGLSKVLPYALLLLTLVCVGLSARRLGGGVAAWVAVALCLSSGLYLACIVGGVSRAFGFPIAAGVLLALAYGSVAGLAGLTLAGAAFYPVAGVLAGLSLALFLLLPMSRSAPGERASFAKRFGTLALVGLGCVLLVLPPAIQGRRYGRMITIADWGAFPEAGPGGRYRSEDRAPFRLFPKSVVRDAEQGLRGAGTPLVAPISNRVAGEKSGRSWRLFLAVVLAIAGAGWIRLAMKSLPARRMLILPAAAAAGDLLARAGYPYFYLPQRYSLYAIPPIAAVVLACGAVGWIPERRRGAFGAALLAALPGILTLVAGGGRGSPDEGLNAQADPSDAAYAFVRGLPEDALVAGWPTGGLENVPWVSRRRAFLTRETHQAQHELATLEARKRAEAVIEAFYATTPEPLVRLRDQFGVTHFLVDLDLARTRTADYFAPFDQEIRQLRERAGSDELEILRRIGDAAVFRNERIAVLDLKRIAPGD